MHSQIGSSCWLAAKDWLHEYLVSICSVLALASMLTPILVLLGLRTGIISAMQERLLSDPATLIIVPKSDAGNFTREDINKFASFPGTAWATGKIRATASDLTMENNGTRVSLSLEPADDNEPVLKKSALNAPQDGMEPQIILSEPAAKALHVSTGQTITANLSRRTPAGAFESIQLHLKVSGILPLTTASRRMAFIPSQLMEDIESYRDYLDVESRGWPGTQTDEPKKYASFRLYAKNLDAVESLANKFASLNIEVTTRAREIANIKALEAAINQIILIISIAMGAGFTAFMLSSSAGAIRRKRKMLAVLRLFGMKRIALIFYPLAQTFLTAITGFVFSLLLYFAIAGAIAHSFRDKGALECCLAPLDFAATFLLVLLLSALASLQAANQAAHLEPSMVIREM